MWWRRLPMGLIRAYLTQLPRLRAVESMRGAGSVAAGSGSLPTSAARKWWREMERSARAGQPERAVKPSIEQVQAMGFGIAILPPEADGG